MTPDLPPRVEVEWLDAHSAAEWTPREKAVAAEPARCFTLGYLLYEDAAKVVLGHSMNTGDDESDWTVIPRGCVVGVRRLNGNNA